MLLIMFKCSWGFYKAEKIPFPDFDVSKAVMRCHNEEGPGRDVEVPHHHFKITNKLYIKDIFLFLLKILTSFFFQPVIKK